MPTPIDIVQSIAIIASLIVSIWQMRALNNQLRAATDAALSEKLDSVNRLLFENADLFKDLESDFITVSASQQNTRLEFLVAMLFNTFEQAFVQHKKYGYLDREDWMPWKQMLAGYLQKPYINTWWSSAKHEYETAFREHIDTINNQNAGGKVLTVGSTGSAREAGHSG